ncbi:hypothetical protein D3C72_2545540 [compost metagenome]
MPIGLLHGTAGRAGGLIGAARPVRAEFAVLQVFLAEGFDHGQIDIECIALVAQEQRLGAVAYDDP